MGSGVRILERFGLKSFWIFRASGDDGKEPYTALELEFDRLIIFTLTDDHRRSTVRCGTIVPLAYSIGP